MTIGIMGAMLEEIDSIHAHMTELSIIERGGRTYHVGKIFNQDVILVFSRWGKVASASTVTSLITEFHIDQLIFIGVAGASSPLLNIGDIVIASQLYQHDMDARPLLPRYQIPLTAMTFFQADSVLIEKARRATKGLFTSLTQKIAADSLASFNITSPKYRIGTIATGDQFIYDQKRTQAIMLEQPETVAVEMEGAAVAQVCTDYAIPFVVIRTISDKADHSAELDFPRFIKEISRHYAEHIVLGMLS